MRTPSISLCLSLVLAILICSACISSAQEKPFYLHDGDTVVFYGDSITEQRFYTYWVQVYAETRFPHMHLNFYSVGVGGDRVSGGGGGPIDLRLARDVFPQQPTVVTIMLGMNDGGYKPLDAATEAAYTQGYEHILDSIQHTLPAARITLLGASPYDEVTHPEMFPGGYNSTLVHFAAIDADLARKHNQTFIDLNAPFVAALKRGYAINPLATQLLLPDRVHPEQLGHWFMAAAILKGWNAPALVSSVTLDGTAQTILDQKNTHVTNLHGGDDSLAWTELDEALPLPLDDAHAGNHFVRQLEALDEELNQQPLKITGLKPGSYSLSIDGHQVSKFTSDELAQGINLALLNTPMRGQAYRVSWQTRDRDDTHYVRLRAMVDQMNTGISHEKLAADLLDFERVQQQEIFTTAQPVPHDFEIKAVIAAP